MGTINYSTGDFITVGVDVSLCDVEYDENMNYVLSYCVEQLINECEPFEWFNVAMHDGYYEGFCVTVNQMFYGYECIEDMQEAYSEVDRIKKLLYDIMGVGLVVCKPGWCTTYYNNDDSYNAIENAVARMRATIVLDVED